MYNWATFQLGPEEYALKKAVKGSYKIKAKLFSFAENQTSTTVLVTIWTHFGNPQLEEETFAFVRLEKPKQVVHIATVTFY